MLMYSRYVHNVHHRRQKLLRCVNLNQKKNQPAGGSPSSEEHEENVCNAKFHDNPFDSCLDQTGGLTEVNMMYVTM